MFFDQLGHPTGYNGIICFAYRGSVALHVQVFSIHILPTTPIESLSDYCPTPNRKCSAVGYLDDSKTFSDKLIYMMQLKCGEPLQRRVLFRAKLTTGM